MLTWVAIDVAACLLLWALAIADERIPRRRKLALVALLGYVASPIDVVPDFIPVVGQLDDVLAVALVLRFVLRSAEDDLLAEHWPGPPRALALLRR
jgi:uncharacterized membrane protein YkvA (DUF1232 family)